MLRLYTHPACRQHDPGRDHAEAPQRLRAVEQALEVFDASTVTRHQAPLASDEQLLRVHTRNHVAQIRDAHPGADGLALDADTIMSADSPEAALRAAGAACAGVAAVMDHPQTPVFCAVRPPGHHATADTAMGFCLFNNVAVAAAEALAAHGLQRVAVADFDVHHGNGTQAIFADDPRLLYLSSHQVPLFPGTGEVNAAPTDTCLNVSLPPETGSAGFRHAWADELLPRLDAFQPQLLLVSAGFDAHRADPLAQLELDTDDYAWLTSRLHSLAQTHAGGRLVSCLEGGYAPRALSASVTTHIDALLGH